MGASPASPRRLLILALALGMAAPAALHPDTAPARPTPSTAAAANPAAATTNPPVGGPDLSLPTDPAAQYRVGFTVFASNALSTQNTYLAYSLPLLVRNALLGLETHAYDAAEKDRARRHLRDTALLAAQRAITAARAARDTLAFGAASTATLKAADGRVASAVARQDFIATLDISLIPIPDEKPVVVQDGNADGLLFPTPTVPLEVFCADHSLDLVIGGTVSEIQGYIVVDVWAWDPLRGTTVFTARDAGLRDELYAQVQALGRGITGSILGRDWAAVAFAPSPSQSSLFIDGVLVARGAAPALYPAPGAHQVSVSAPGHVTVTRAVTLTAGTVTTIADTLTPESSGAVAITTDPIGASLYLDSIFQGTTPISIPRPPLRERAVMSLDGFYDSPFSLTASTPDSIAITLRPDTGDRARKQKQARDDFYTSFGIFAASLPLPLFSYGLTNDFFARRADFLLQGMGTEARDAGTVGYVFLGTYYAGIAISVALFSWMVNRIITYVTVSNGTAG